MRGIWLVAAIGACAALSSCDQDPQQTAQNAAPPPPPACACRPTAPQETAAAVQPAMPGAHHRHRHWRSRDSRMAWNGRGHWRGDYARTDFTESVLAPYDYVSASSVTYVESDASYSRSYEMRYRGGYRRGGGDTIPASMSGERLDPWAGYGVRCRWQ
jgi:hypothetical protein